MPATKFCLFLHSQTHWSNSA